MHRNFSLHMWQAAGGWAVLLSHMRVEDFSPLCTPTKRALSLPNDPLTMLREIIALWAIWTLLCPFLRLTVTWLKIFLDEMIDETFFVRLSVISRSKARFDQCKITKTSSRSSEAVSRKTSLSNYIYSDVWKLLILLVFRTSEEVSSIIMRSVHLDSTSIRWGPFIWTLEVSDGVHSSAPRCLWIEGPIHLQL